MKSHVMYVWLDALSNYITAIGYGNTGHTESVLKNTGRRASRRKGHPPLSHDLLVVVPARRRFGIPKTVYAHGMWLDADGKKMGKTLGNVIEVDVLHEHFQVDAVRYFRSSRDGVRSGRQVRL